jgi:hypothetical protein
MLFILAHGPSGPFDELVPIIALVIFLALMAASVYTSWRQNHKQEQINAPAQAADSPDHFRLE